MLLSDAGMRHEKHKELEEKKSKWKWVREERKKIKNRILAMLQNISISPNNQREYLNQMNALALYLYLPLYQQTTGLAWCGAELFYVFLFCLRLKNTKLLNCILFFSPSPISIYFTSFFSSIVCFNALLIINNG